MLSLTEFKGPKNLNLKNRIVMAPMCMYQSDENGMVKAFHKTHYGARALGGVSLIIVEATAVDPGGRISGNDLGIWSPSHIRGLKELVDEAHSYGAKIGIQLNHAGRKAHVREGETPVGVSSLAYNEEMPVPDTLDKDGIEEVIRRFRDAAKRAAEAGFDVLEIHGAHGYLIHQFLSAISNRREDAYGGSLENRTRFLRELLAEVKKVWPSDRALMLRVSADDYLEGGITVEDMVEIVNNVRPFVDVVHVSTGGIIETEVPCYSGYQIGHGEKIRKECGIPTIGVGMIKTIEQIEDILAEDRVDLVSLGRELLRDPNFVMNEAFRNDKIYDIPQPYERAYMR